MFQLLCVCLFLGKYANSYHTFEPSHKEQIKDEELKRKMLSYYEHSWEHSSSSDLDVRIGSSFNSPITIIQHPTIERTYRTEITVKQLTHPYLFTIMQMLPIKSRVSFKYIYQKLFQFYLALQRFKPFNSAQIPKILLFVFPELGDKIYEIVKLPSEPRMLKALFEAIFPGLSTQDFDLIFNNAHTTKEVIISFILFLCPNIREHFLWKEDLPVDGKLQAIFDILFPGAPALPLTENISFIQKIYGFLELLFQGKLIHKPEQPPQMGGPEWIIFQNDLQHQFNINYEIVPKDILIYLYSNYKTPRFNIYVNQLKLKLDEEKQPNKMDSHTLLIWKQYLTDLKTHKKTLNDIPPEIAVFIEQQENPQEFIKILSDVLGFPVDAAKLNLPLDPEIKELWKKFTMDLMMHHGDTAHLPKELLNYFSSLSQNPNYKSYLDSIFDSLYIKPEMVFEWNIFFDQLREGKTTLNEMPTPLITFLKNTQHPEEFLRLILKLKDSKSNTSFLNIDTNPKILQLWKQYINDVAANKGKLQNIPQELLDYFYKISSNPENAEYIKLILGPEKINPKTLIIWKQYINNLKQHRVDLKDMPSEVIQLMLKYDSPDEFFKVVLPDSQIQAVPNDIVKNQWKEWTSSLQNHDVSIHDTPKELKDFFHQLSPSKDYQSVLNDIYSINPDLLMKWKLFMDDLKQHKKSLATIPEDLKKYISAMRPKEFINLIFKGLVPPLDDVIPNPKSPKKVDESWEKLINKLNTENYLDFIKIPYYLSEYLHDASDNPNYKKDLYYLYQLPGPLKTQFDDFKIKMMDDYNTTLKSLPEQLAAFMIKLEQPADFFTGVLASYPGYHPVDFTNADEMPDLLNIWQTSLKNMFLRNDNTEIPYLIKIYINNVMRNTPLGKEIDEVIKMHERNSLLVRAEDYWNESKTRPKVDDGLKVFLQVLKRLGHYYAKSEELCEERTRIIEVLDEVKEAFAAKSKCMTI